MSFSYTLHLPTHEHNTPVQKTGVWTRWSQVVVGVLPCLRRETGDPALLASGTVLFSWSVRSVHLGMSRQTARWRLGSTAYFRPLAGRTQRKSSVVDMVSNTLYRGPSAHGSQILRCALLHPLAPTIIKQWKLKSIIKIYKFS